MCVPGSKETLGTVTNRTSLCKYSEFMQVGRQDVETVSHGCSGDKERVVGREGSPVLCSRALLAGRMQASA